MKCDSCGDEIGNLGDDWVALGKSGDICTVCAAEEIAKLRAEVERLREENTRLKSDLKDLDEAYNHLEASENC